MPKPDLRDALAECLAALAEQQRQHPETPPVPTKPATMGDALEEMGQAMAIMYATKRQRPARR